MKESANNKTSGQTQSSAKSKPATAKSSRTTTARTNQNTANSAAKKPSRSNNPEGRNQYTKK